MLDNFHKQQIFEKYAGNARETILRTWNICNNNSNNCAACANNANRNLNYEECPLRETRSRRVRERERERGKDVGHLDDPLKVQASWTGRQGTTEEAEQQEEEEANEATTTANGYKQNIKRK